MKEHPACLPVMEEARKLISLLEFSEDGLGDSEHQSMRNNLMMMLWAEKEDKKERRHVVGKPWLSNQHIQWFKIAATIIMLPLVSFSVFFFLGGSDNPILSLKTENAKGVEHKISPIGQQSVLFLADGTKVWLNASSKITYLENFQDRDTRDVYLEGEAFFDVAHNEEKPFIVHTSSIKIKVLGTSFNVKSYSQEKTIETTLVQGKVRIEQSDIKGNRIGDVELKPNQRAVFDKESKVINIKEVVTAGVETWKQERLVFDEESIDHVLMQMEKWYHVKIHVENKGNLHCKLTATIEKESLEEVLKLMETSHNIHYKIKGSEVFIEGEFCESRKSK